MDRTCKKEKKRCFVTLETVIFLLSREQTDDVPFPFGFGGQINAGEVKPLNGTLLTKAFWLDKYNEERLINCLKRHVVRLGCRIRSFLRMTLGGTGSMWARWGQRACLRRLTGEPGGWIRRTHGCGNEKTTLE